MSTNQPIIAGDVPDSGRAAAPGDRPGVPPGAAESPADTLWTVREVAHYLRLPVSSIYKMTARAAAVRIPHIHIGGTLRFRRVDVDRWLTLLTISNIETLARMRERVSR